MMNSSFVALYNILYRYFSKQGEKTKWRVSCTGSAVPVLARQRYSRFLSINHPHICPPTCSLVYLSIISYPANVVPLRPSLASLAEQVQLHSLQSMLLVLEPVWCGYILIESTTKLWLKTNTLSHSIYLRPETVLLSLSLSLSFSVFLSLPILTHL